MRPGLALILALAAGACGEELCSLSNPCPEGSYCIAGHCRSACASTSECDAGICTPDGRCAREQPDPDAGVCAATVLEAEFGTPTAVLLVDQSRSMEVAYGSSTRWDVLRDALIHPANGVVSQHQDEIRFGLTLYTGILTPELICPDLTTVPPALNNRDAIAAEYTVAAPVSGTPTPESIEAVTAALRAYPEQGAKNIILATDGEPATCANLMVNDGQEESVAAAQAAFAAGIRLFILSVGSGTVSAEHMQDVANAGVGFPIGGSQNAPYWEAADAAQLAEAFDIIAARLLSCDITVNGVIQDDAVASGVIYLDGVRLLLDDPDGWVPLDASTFRLQGVACTRVKRAGVHTVTAEFGCEAPAPADLSAEGGGVVEPGCAASRPMVIVAALALAVLFGSARRRRSNREH